MTVHQRIEQALWTHFDAGVEPRLIIMSPKTMYSMINELAGPLASYGMYWTRGSDGMARPAYYGLTIELRDFIQDGEVIIGV